MINKFKFCPNCKHKLNNYKKRLFDCPNCRFHFYLNPAPTNALIIENDKEEILLVKRKFNPYKNHWDLPGGFTDFGETVEESLIREIKEEINIDLKNFNYLGSFIDKYFYRGINYQTICFIFYTKLLEKHNLKASDDVSEIKFFSRKKLPWKQIGFKGIVQGLKKYLKILK